MVKKPKNTTAYAIWLDHKKAIVVTADGKGILKSEILLSGIESHERFKGETSSKNRLFGTTLDAESKLQNHDHEVMNQFLKKVIAGIPVSAAFVLIAGPAEAKYDLHRALSKKKSLSHVRLEIKTAGKLKPGEIAALLKTRMVK